MPQHETTQGGGEDHLHAHGQMQMIPIESTLSEDVFIVGFPKSGNTWMQNLIAGVFFGCSPDQTPDTVVQHLVPDVHERTHYLRFGDRAFFKSHHLPREQYKTVIYLVRDGRDAMVSYFQFVRALLGERSFHDFIAATDIFPGRWEDHVEQWCNNPFGSRLLMVRYEDLITDCVQELVRICEFLGYPKPLQRLTTVAEQASFGRMQQREKESGWENKSWPADKLFIRRGVVGSYKDEMPVEILKEFMTPKTSLYLRRLGYQ